MPNDEWAVGLFEGEGTIIVRPERTNAKAGYIELSLSSTDEDVIQSFAAAVIHGCIYGPYRYNGNKPYWKWCVYGDEATTILRWMLPLLHSRRAKKAQEALMAHEQRKAAPHHRCSRRGVGGRPTHKHES